MYIRTANTADIEEAVWVENLIFPGDIAAAREMHDENGAGQMIFGLEILPEYRRQGCAAMLLSHVEDAARNQGRKGLVLTCEEHLVHYYEKSGFVNEGISSSGLLEKTWYQMRKSF